MKKIVVPILITAVCAFASFANAAEEKKVTPKKSGDDNSKSAATAEHTMVAPADVKWMDGPPFLPPGVKLAVLEGDPGKAGSFTIRLQFPDGYKIPAHTHPTAERVTVISGTLYLGMGDKLDETAGHEMVAGSFAGDAGRDETFCLRQERSSGAGPRHRTVRHQICESDRRPA